MIIGHISDKSKAQRDGERVKALTAALEILENANRRSAMARRARVRIATELSGCDVCRYNFHDRTAAIFHELPELPGRTPDFVSRGGSQYWFTDEGVVRLADHWGRSIRSCDWFLAGEELKLTCLNGDVEIRRGVSGRLTVAFCAWESFRRRPASVDGLRTQIPYDELAA